MAPSIRPRYKDYILYFASKFRREAAADGEEDGGGDDDDEEDEDQKSIWSSGQ